MQDDSMLTLDQWVMSHIRTSHVTSHTWIRHVTSYTWIRHVTSHTWIRHVAHTNESFRTPGAEKRRRRWRMAACWHLISTGSNAEASEDILSNNTNAHSYKSARNILKKNIYIITISSARSSSYCIHRRPYTYNIKLTFETFQQQTRGIREYHGQQKWKKIPKSQLGIQCSVYTDRKLNSKLIYTADFREFSAAT